jgi:hypothetical protein
MHRSILLVIAAVTVACGARNNGSHPTDSLEGSAAAVLVRSGGSPLPVFLHDNQWYLLGEEGLKYEICIRNQIDSTIEAVLSVDGRDAVSGRVADFRRDRGYVILAGEEVCIEGFRQSLDQVAAFEFTARRDSYAAQMGDDVNVGVIGVAVFDEASEKAPVAIAASQSESAKEAAPEPAGAPIAEGDDAAEIADGAQGVGTGYGGSVDSAAEIVRFKRRSDETPLEILSLYYDNREGLEAAGIRIPDEVALPESRPTPNPFPGAGSPAFAPPPPGN